MENIPKETDPHIRWLMWTRTEPEKSRYRSHQSRRGQFAETALLLSKNPTHFRTGQKNTVKLTRIRLSNSPQVWLGQNKLVTHCLRCEWTWADTREAADAEPEYFHRLFENVLYERRCTSSRTKYNTALCAFLWGTYLLPFILFFFASFFQTPQFPIFLLCKQTQMWTNFNSQNI